MQPLLLSFLFIPFLVRAYNPLYRSWNCIGVASSFVGSKPHVWNMGDLPMVLWKEGDEWLTRPNVCSHMGSRLDTGCRSPTGGLKCGYHGMVFGKNDTLGCIVQQEEKLFWAYEPEQAIPSAVPHYGEEGYDSFCFEYEMPCSLPDSAYNSMDLHHPEYVHQNLFGFGSDVPPSNIVNHVLKGETGFIETVGLSFDYSSYGLSSKVTLRGDSMKKTSNYHLYKYPSFTWSKVTFGETNHLIVGVHFLQVGPKRTKWFVSVAQNYVKPWQRPLVYAMAMSILNQDREQMKKQAPENMLKREIMFGRLIQDEKVLDTMREWFRSYKYPDMYDSMELLRYHRVKQTLGESSSSCPPTVKPEGRNE